MRRTSSRPKAAIPLRVAAFVLLGLLAAGCTDGPIYLATPESPSPAPSPVATGLADADVETDDARDTVPPAGSMQGFAGGYGMPTSCSTRDGGRLPDPACTPGVTNPAVTQANITSTICTPGWASAQRPDASFTTPRKRESARAYGYVAGTDLSTLRYDHLVPISVGGHPRDVKNLYNQDLKISLEKDKVEGAANREVCSGKLSLAEAQAGFMADWVELGRKLGVAGL